MVSDTYEPTKKGKATSAAELEIKIQSKDSKRLKETIKDYKRLRQSKDYKKSPKICGNWQSSSTSYGLD